MRHVLFSLLAAVAISAMPLTVVADDVVAAALEVALSRNAVHAREWLEQKDFKSLVQSASGLQVLAELLQSRSDGPPWQAAAGGVLKATRELSAAAGSDDLAKSLAALEALDKSVTAAKQVRPSGKAAALSKPPGIRPLMLLMDGVLADAKVSLVTGNVETAKSESRVVAELGKLVSQFRSTPEWSSLAGDFCEAATAAADSTETDAKAVRQRIHAVSQRCDACHEKSRTR